MAPVNAHGPSEFVIDVNAVTEEPILLVRGEIDFETSSRLREAFALLARDDEHPLTVDLAGVTFVDSVGLSVLIQVKKRFDAAGQPLRLANVPPSVRTTIEIAGATDFFGIGGR
jgi:anti-sigma B factor antagonist